MRWEIREMEDEDEDEYEYEYEYEYEGWRMKCIGVIVRLVSIRGGSLN